MPSTHLEQESQQSSSFHWRQGHAAKCDREQEPSTAREIVAQGSAQTAVSSCWSGGMEMATSPEARQFTTHFGPDQACTTSASSHSHWGACCPQGPHGHTNRCSDTSSCLWGRNPPLHQGSQACAHNQNSLLEGRCWWTLLDINSPHLWVREPGYTDTFKWLGARHNQH